jgi:hypothetical protein
LDDPVNSYHSLELLAQDRGRERARECAMAALAAQIDRGSPRGYRDRLAQRLRAFARRIDPAVEASLMPSAAMSASVVGELGPTSSAA